MPTLPLRMDSRKTVVGGSFWNAFIACTPALCQQEHYGGRILLECLYWLQSSRADVHEVVTSGSVIQVQMGMHTIATASPGNAVKQSSQQVEIGRLAHLRSKC